MSISGQAALQARADARSMLAADGSVRRFTTGDGVRIAWYAWGRPGPQPPVVLHHGFAADAQINWVAPGLVQALLDSGRSVLALDARGHGASDKPHDPAHYGETRMARDLRELLAHLSIGRFDLFGYSMGAIVGLLVASAGDAVRRLVIGGVGEGVLLSGGVDLRVMDRQAVVAALLAEDPASITHPGAGLFRAFAARNGADPAALAAQAVRMHAQPIALERITAPTLLLAGREDPLAMNPQRLAAAIADAGCLVLPGDHLGLVGQPAFARAAIEFLNCQP